MKRSLFAYLIIIFLLCAGFVIGAKMMGKQGMYIASGYMLAPAIAAIITRLFFHRLRFKDADLRFDKFKDHIKFWLVSLGYTALSFVLFTVMGAIRWDFSGQIFLDLLAKQFTETGQDMTASLPPGFTPQMMLWLFVIGGLTVFNIFPGIINGFGEEFGHRGLMFPLLLPNKPWLGLIIGGILWYLWHQPLALILPAAAPAPLWQTIICHLFGIIGSICMPISVMFTQKAGASSCHPLLILR